MKYRHALLAVAGASLLAAVTTTSPSLALPSVGDARPQVTLVDAWDRTLQIGAAANKPILVVYEDSSSAKQNQALKDELAKLAKSGKYKEAITLVAVADLAGYDYWPVKGFVKDAIRDESRKFGTTIFCDWNGAARAKIGLKRGVSNVILYGRDGKVLFAHEGAMPAEKRRQLIALLREQVGE
ncbi:MAG: hypothetical protein KC657_38450 [Myxococcales bacterium]|nr:hypothetical protein [Myxococcales bacterium]MCA9591258.1 hypothetical protein [Myxococcales bacterium]